MKRLILALYSMCVLLTMIGTYASAAVTGDGIKDFNAPIPESAKKTLVDIKQLVERDRLAEADTALKKVISTTPNFVNAHAEYITLQAGFLGRPDDVRREYEDLMKREPNNPVYPMALALGYTFAPPNDKSAWLQKVVDTTPSADWSWSHYAKGILSRSKEPETAVAELKKYIEMDGSWLQAYYDLAAIQNLALKKIDDAVATAEKIAAHPAAHSWDTVYFWRMRLTKAGGSEQARAELRKELESLAGSAHDVKTLDAIRLAYKDLLKDKEQESKTETKLRQIDPAWYPERGRISYVTTINSSGILRRFAVANNQFAYYKKIGVTESESQPEEKLAAMLRLVSPKLSAQVRQSLYERIFDLAAEEKDIPVLIKYGELAFAGDSRNLAIHSTIAMILAEKKDIPAAMRYAKSAERETSTFQPFLRPANDLITENEWNKQFTEEIQQNHFKKMRSLALEALGWVNYQAGNLAQAETSLKQSVELSRTEKNLFRLSEVLAGLGRKAEAEDLAKESANLYATNLKQRFTKQPAKDFELTTIDGRKLKLSDLKGKVVMLDFWATWCTPCVKSIPVLAKVYEKYKDRGLEILYISADSNVDRYKVAPLVKEKNINFPVMFDSGAVEAYGVKPLPTTIFIDPAGNVRYREMGFSETESQRTIETVVELLLQDK